MYFSEALTILKISIRNSRLLTLYFASMLNFGLIAAQMITFLTYLLRIRKRLNKMVEFIQIISAIISSIYYWILFIPFLLVSFQLIIEINTNIVKTS